MFGFQRFNAPARYRRGRLVQVRSAAEILATLDADGRHDGLPFMPEMLRFCGRRFRVYRRLTRVFLDHYYRVVGLKGLVMLEDLRCDGRAHGRCHLGCRLLWKEAWLKPAEEAAPELAPAAEGLADTLASGRLPTKHGDRYCCQATELIHISFPLPWWDLRQYARDLLGGDMTLGEFGRMLGLLVVNKVRRLCGRPPWGLLTGRADQPVAGRLNLQPGQWVEVKSRPEIEATLDARQRTAGLAFSPEMTAFCGRRFRVARRVENVILEWSGQRRRLRDTVALEGATCDGAARRGCARDCYQLWREAWLKPVPDPAAVPTPPATAGVLAERAAGPASCAAPAPAMAP